MKASSDGFERAGLDQLVDRSVRLVDFLLASVRAGEQIISQLEGYPVALELTYMPDVLSTTLRHSASSGEVLFSVSKVSLEPPPRPPRDLRPWLGDDLNDSSVDVLELREDRLGNLPPKSLITSESFITYQRSWQAWAARDRLDKEHLRWYEELERCRKRLESEGDSFELVLGVGALSWKTPGRVIEHPVAVVRCQVKLDKKSARLDVAIDGDAVPRFVDRQLLEGVDGYHFDRTLGLREQLRQASVPILSEDMKLIASRWLDLALERHRPFEEGIVEIEVAEEIPAMSWSPVLIYRKRDRSSLIGFYETMLEELSGDDVDLPLGLAEMVEAIELEDREQWLEDEGAVKGEVLGSDPLFPLPSNPEQRQIIDRLRFDNGVVVQGPPGTGKTHTIANLLTALLARGQRVLVTSQKDQALRVLKEKLPLEIQPLCITSTDLKRGGSTELDQGVTALSDRHSRFSPEQHARELDGLVALRRDALVAQKHAKEELRSLRESETLVHPEIAPGYQGTKAKIVQALSQHKDSFPWMPLPVSAATPKSPSLSTDELVELLQLLRSATPERVARIDQDFIDVARLLAPEKFQEMVETEVQAARVARQLASSVSELLSALSKAETSQLQTDIVALDDLLYQLQLGQEIASWPDNWVVDAIRAGLSNDGFGAWTQHATVASAANKAKELLDSIGTQAVSLPTFSDDGEWSLPAQLAIAKSLQEQIASGRSIRPRLLRSGVQREASRLIDEATVDGRSIADDPKSLRSLIAVMEAQLHVQRVVNSWASLGVKVVEISSLPAMAAELVVMTDRLERVMRLTARVADIDVWLVKRGMRIGLTSPRDVGTLRDAVSGLEAAYQAEEASGRIQIAFDFFTTEAVKSSTPPEIASMAHAISMRDTVSYQESYERYRSGPQEKQLQQRCDELLDRLRNDHPALAFMLADTASDGDWPQRIAQMPEAWSYAVAWSFIDRQRDPGRDARLAADLEAATRAVLRATAAEAACRAWGERLPKMNAVEVTALKAYRAAVTARGHGYGRWAGRYAADARQAMTAARSAVPAWIMPISQVVETIKPDRYSFDVVIVDEASQAGIDAMFLLWLAPRIIVVGDDRQCAPSEIVRGGNQAVFDRLDDYLPDMPSYLRGQLTPNSNLFTLLSTRFGSVIRLREHFRCMPEIITWSSQQFYRDEPLVPLRQFGAERLPPIRTHYVEDGVSEGKSTSMVNLAEAKALVNQLRECLEDDSYADKTFGVIVLQSAAQAQLIDRLIQESIPLDVIEDRRIRVGTPPDFQGDERDVIFLSLVISDRASAFTRKDWQRRYNVAASRARDQMWLFHSVTSDLLSPQDLRRSLLTYMLSPPPPLARGSFPDLTWDSPLTDPFDSVFEQRVYIELRDRGYAVTPQFEINGRRIDLLVTGAKGQLAVECDGDYWHSSPEAVQKDIDRELELQRAGMRFWRVRESEFYLDREGAMSGLWRTLSERGIEPGSLAVGNTNVDPGSEEWTSVVLSDEEGLDGIDGDASDLDHYERTDRHRARRSRAAQIARRVGQFAFDLNSDSPQESNEFKRDEVSSGQADTAASWEVRKWALEHGFSAGVRGRLPSEVIEAWNRQYPERPFYG